MKMTMCSMAGVGLSVSPSGVDAVATAVEHVIRPLLSTLPATTAILMSGVCALAVIAVRGSRPRDRAAVLRGLAEVVRSLPPRSKPCRCVWTAPETSSESLSNTLAATSDTGEDRNTSELTYQDVAVTAREPWGPFGDHAVCVTAHDLHEDERSASCSTAFDVRKRLTT
jgi:hypothetical protein